MEGMTFDSLSPGQALSGFTAEARYRNSAGEPIGARFRHLPSGLVLDLITIQTVPQAFLTVHTFPVSNKGEPHTQEHLVLGKGNAGRAVAARETLSLVESTAFTQQLKTCYPFAANAGVESFFGHLGRALHALLHPDYTDEEIRREVRHFGVKTNAQGQLELEKKGTIYTEMVSSSAQPGYRVLRAMGRLLYGDQHPCSYDSGGHPAAIREMLPEDIRRFHAAHYHLGNMELIACLPRGLTLEQTLARFDAILTPLAAGQVPRPALRWRDLPAPSPAPPNTTRIVEFPSRNPQQPGPALIAWPVHPRLDLQEEGLADLFAQAFGGDPSTNLYKLFIDSQTRRTDIGARSISFSLDNETDSCFCVYIPDLAVSQANPERLAEIASLVSGELHRIAVLEDHGPELLAFHDRMHANLVRMRRSADKLTSSPPGFGARGSRGIWPGLLRDLNLEPGFEKNLLQPELFNWLEAQLATGQNLWRGRLAAWGLLEPPAYHAASRPSPALLEQEEQQLAARLAAETARLEAHYGAPGPQQALALYQADFDRATAELEDQIRHDPPARFIDTPPLTLDDSLDWSAKTLAGSVPALSGSFPGMASATIGLALDARCLSGRQLIYAALLPNLWSGAGCTRDGITLSYEETMQRLRREILALSAFWSANPATGRFELVWNASGNTLEESLAALAWLEATLLAPNWQPGNLPRLRDLAAQSANSLRGVMQRSEEHWVHEPARSWTYQHDSHFLSATNFLTEQLHVHRLNWLLADPASAPAFEADIEYLVHDLPEDTRAGDEALLREQAAQDWATAPAEVIAELNELRQLLLRRAHARVHLTGSPAHLATLEPHVESLLGQLSPGPAAPRQSRQRTRPVAARLLARTGLAAEPRYTALLAPNMQGGVHLHSVPGTRIEDTSEDALLDFLAFKLFSGSGPHGIFMKTWAAGLAYSNGLRASAMEGRNHYYAERTPLLPQTMRFVSEQLKNAPREQPLAEYALAQVFAGTRSGSSFESRVSGLAADLADGQGPEVVRAFRERILALRRHPRLNEELYARIDRLYGRLLPGYQPPGPASTEETFFVIGPEKQILAWEDYLGQPVARLYPRDYWIGTE